ncbi:MAG: porin family protein [Gammaproteobacteria bacterium]|nr:porin family protein [Gammaproteobacteria bacterium]
MNNLMKQGRTWVATAIASVLLLPAVALADSGFYLGGSAGGATLEADINDISIPGLPSSIDEDDTAYKLFAGYTFDGPVLNLGIEGGYVNFGQPDIDVFGDTLLVDTDGLNLWGIAALDAGPVEIYGKLGMIAWDVTADYLGSSAKEDGTDVAYGAGLRFKLGPVKVRGEYEIYDLDGADLGMLSVGIAYQFN